MSELFAVYSISSDEGNKKDPSGNQNLYAKITSDFGCRSSIKPEESQ